LLAWREKCRLRAFENRVLRRIFGPKNDEVTGVEKTKQQKALCSVLLTKYHSGDQVKKTDVGRTCSMYGGEERCIQEKLEERRPLGRPRCRWEDNIWHSIGTGGGIL
jgi:hypothetical protein